MKVELRDINTVNNERSKNIYLIEECEALRVAEEQAQYIASNGDSLKEAAANSSVARPFAIYIDDKMVGFTMFAFDEDYEDPNDRYWLWRFMIDKSLQGKGYGTLALKEIISYFKKNGAHNIKLSTKESNVAALSLYHRFGFQENGEMNDGEIVLNLNL